jgi:hypothetical protein
MLHYPKQRGKVELGSVPGTQGSHASVDSSPVCSVCSDGLLRMVYLGFRLHGFKRHDTGPRAKSRSSQETPEGLSGSRSSFLRRTCGCKEAIMGQSGVSAGVLWPSELQRSLGPIHRLFVLYLLDPDN